MLSCVRMIATRPLALAAPRAAAAASRRSGAAAAAAGGCRLLPALRAFSAAAKAEKVELKTPEDQRVIVVTSGKGGVGKTTTSCSFAYGLAQQGFRTLAIDFDIGLRNLDLHLGMERRIVFDFVHAVHRECSIHQALVKDKRNPNLYLMAASQTKDKTALDTAKLTSLMDELRKEFDYIICDSPAGIESGAYHAMYFADHAVVCTNPEVSSVRDSDKMMGLLLSKSKRAVEDREPPSIQVCVTRYDADRATAGDSLSVVDIEEMLGFPIVGAIPESAEVLRSTNIGKPVILSNSDCAEAYKDMVSRFLGEKLALRFTQPSTFVKKIRNIFN